MFFEAQRGKMVFRLSEKKGTVIEAPQGRPVGGGGGCHNCDMRTVFPLSKVIVYKK